MGRLSKSEENNSRFVNVQYTKLKDDQYNTGSGESLQVMPGFEGYLSFSCRQCGHLQIFQGAELDMILGKSLKMAFRSGNKDKPDNVQSSKSNQKTPDNATAIAKRDSVDNKPTAGYRPFQEKLDGSSIGIPLMVPEAARSTISSDDSNSPTQLNQFKRIAEKPSLMKRIGKGFVSSVSDEEGYPLVVSDGSSSIPGSQSSIPLMNVDYGNDDSSTMRIGEASNSVDPIWTKGGGRQLLNDFNTSSNSTEEESREITLDEGASRKDNNLKKAPWYQEGIPREIALEILSQEPIGSFMVRRSTTKSGCFALSVRVPRSFQPRGIAHYLIMRTNKGFRIKGFTKDFPTLASLIAHHSVMPELLPCPLSLNRYHPVCVISDCRRDFADIEPETDAS